MRPTSSSAANIAPGGLLARPRGQPAPAVLLRVRRALRDGGAGRAGRAAHLRLPPARRDRRLEEGERTAGAVSRRPDVNTDSFRARTLSGDRSGDRLPFCEKWRKLRPRFIHREADMTQIHGLGSCTCCGDLLAGRFDRRHVLRAAGGLAAVRGACSRSWRLAATGHYEAMVLGCIDPRLQEPVESTRRSAT